MADRATYQQRREELAAYILAHPQEFCIDLFGVRSACGTTACIAGTAALLAQEQGLCTVLWHPAEIKDGQEQMVLWLVTGNKRRQELDRWAQAYLGLPNTSLFYRLSLRMPEHAAEAILSAPYAEDGV